METTRAKPAQTKSEATPVSQSPKPAREATPVIQTLPLYAGPPTVRLSGGAAGSMHADIPAEVSQAVNAPGSGAPLSPQIQGALESGLGADMSTVRVHTGEQASAAAHTLGARAFTHGSNIFLGAGEHPSNLGLMAHEATHVIQQGGAPAVQMSSATAAPDTLEQEARQAAATVQQGEQVTVTGRTSGLRLQKEEKPSLWSRFKSGVASAASSVASVASAGKDWLLAKAAEYAKRIPGFDLLTVILGKDPITDKPVERNATNLIRGLLGLIPGGTAIFDNLQQSGAIQRAFEWFNKEIARLNLTWETIKGLFRQFWDTLSASDILNPSGVLDRIKEIFGPPLGRLINFAQAAGKKILEFIFEGALSLAGAMGQRVLAIIQRARAVFSLIVNDPIGFLKNLIQAVKGGFLKFSSNILVHLKNALFQWLFGALQGAGLILPDKFDFKGVISIILQVIGLTYARLREKLVKLIGEPAVAFIEKAFEFVKIIVTQGIAAAWQKILEFATGLVDTVIEGIRNWAAKSIVGAAITKLVTMFNPVGAIIQGIITIYNTVMFFIERAQQIAALAEAVFDSIANIASGNLGAAIDYVEKTMARTLPVIIAFLARLIGLGGISDEIKKIIKKIQSVVDKAIDKVVNFVVDKAKALVAKVTGKDSKEAKPGNVKSEARKLLLGRLKSEHTKPQVQQIVDEIFVQLRPQGLKQLRLGPERDDGSFYIDAEASPIDHALLIEEFGRKFGKFTNIAGTVRYRVEKQISAQFVGGRPGGKGFLYQGEKEIGARYTEIPIKSTTRESIATVIHPGREYTVGVPTREEPKEQVSSQQFQFVVSSRGAGQAHAEVQMIKLIENSMAELGAKDHLKDLESIEILSTNSPCGPSDPGGSNCTARLCNFVEGIRKKYNNPGFKFILKYEHAYGNTPDKNISQLESCGITVPQKPKKETDNKVVASEEKVS